MSLPSGASAGSGASNDKKFEQMVSKTAEGRLQAQAIGRQLRVHRQDWHKFVDKSEASAMLQTLPKAAWVLDPQANKQLKLTRTTDEAHVDRLMDVKQAIERDARRDKRTHRPTCCWFPMLHPGSDVVFYWNVFMGLWDATYTSFMIPISIAFITYPCPWNWITVLDLIGGIIFSIDVFMNFHTGFEIMGTARRDVVMNPWAVAKYYIWHDSFITDVLCVIPTPMLLFAQLTGLQEGWIISESAFLKILLLLRLARLWRFFILVQVTGGMQVLYKVFSASVLFFLNVGLSFCVLINFVACLLVWVATQVGKENSWMSSVDEKSIIDEPMGRIYVAAVYFGVSTLAGAGYGDITPHTTLEEGVCAAIMAGGLVFFGFLISSFTHFLSEASASGRSASEFRKKIDSVESWMRRRQLPKLLQTRIKAYYVEVLQPGTENNDVQFFDELPTALRDDVVGYLTKEIMQHSPIFGVLGKHERRHLSRRMVPRVLPKGHDLFKEGDRATSMFILAEGDMLLLRHNQDIQTIRPPAFVGESVILANEWKHARYRETTCRAVTSCLLWELSMDYLQQTVNVYPHIMEELRMSFLDHLKNVVEEMQEAHPSRQLRIAALDIEKLDAMKVFNTVQQAVSEMGDPQDPQDLPSPSLLAENDAEMLQLSAHSAAEMMKQQGTCSGISQSSSSPEQLPDRSHSAPDLELGIPKSPRDLHPIHEDEDHPDVFDNTPDVCLRGDSDDSLNKGTTGSTIWNLPRAGSHPNSGTTQSASQSNLMAGSVPNSVTSSVSSARGVIERWRRSLRRRLRGGSEGLEEPLLEEGDRGEEFGGDRVPSVPPTPKVHHTGTRMSEERFLDLMNSLSKQAGDTASPREYRRQTYS